MGNELSADKNKPTLTRSLSLKTKRTDQTANFNTKSPELVRPLRRSYTFSTYEGNVCSDGFPEKTKMNNELKYIDNPKEASSSIDNKIPLENHEPTNNNTVSQPEKIRELENLEEDKRKHLANDKMIYKKILSDESLKNRDSLKQAKTKENLNFSAQESNAKETSLTDGFTEVIEENTRGKKFDSNSSRRKGLKSSSKKVARSHSFHCYVVEDPFDKSDNVDENSSANNKGTKVTHERRNSDTFLLKMQHVQRSEHFTKMLQKYKEKENVKNRKLSVYSGKTHKDLSDHRVKPQLDRSDTYLENWINNQKERISALSKAVQGDYEYYHALHNNEVSFKGSNIFSLPKRPSTEKIRRKVLSREKTNINDYSSEEDTSEKTMSGKRVLSELVINQDDAIKNKPCERVVTTMQKSVQFKPIRSVSITFPKPIYKRSDHSLDTKDFNQNEVRQPDLNKTAKTSTQIAFGIHSDKKFTKKFLISTQGSYNQIAEL